MVAALSVWLGELTSRYQDGSLGVRPRDQSSHSERPGPASKIRARVRNQESEPRVRGGGRESKSNS